MGARVAASLFVVIVAGMPATALAQIGWSKPGQAPTPAPSGAAQTTTAAPGDASPNDPDAEIRRIVAVKQKLLADPAGYGALLDQLQKQYGQRPMRSVGYLANFGGDVGRAILAGAANTGVSPTFVSVAMFQEGFNLFLDSNQGFDAKHLPVDGFTDIGADSFYGRIPELKRRGYLPSNYDGVTPKSVYGCVQVGKVKGTPYCLKDGPTDYWTNEAGDRFRAFDFKSMKDAATGVAAMLAFDRDRFLSDARTLGIDTNAMSQPDLDAWSYVYYNAGERNGLKLLGKRLGHLPRTPARGATGTINSNPFFNAQRVAASVALYQKLGVFDGANVARYADTRGGAPAQRKGGVAPNEGFHH